MRIVHGLVFLMLSGSFIAGCTAASHTNRTANVNQQAASDKDVREIRELIKAFSEDVGRPGYEPWRKLQTYPDSELINELEEMERNAAPADRIRPQIAFVFCWIDRDCATRVKVIEAALSRSPPYKDFYADDAESMLSQLIERGKKDLLKPLFESATWSDGALSEGLTDTFDRELRKDAEQFLKLLSTYPTDTRKRVYWLIKSAGPFSGNELTVLQARLSALPKTSQAYEPARELLATLSTKQPGSHAPD